MKNPFYSLSNDSLTVAKAIGCGLGASLLLLPILAYGWRQAQRPDRSEAAQVLFQGITYQRQVRISPRPNVVHIVQVDLSQSNIRPFVTPADPVEGDHAAARTTSEFVEQFQLQIAINGHFFHPFREETPWNYFPHSGELARPVGLAVAAGESYAPASDDFPALCFLSKQAVIRADGTCPAETTEAIAGTPIVLQQGQPAIPADFAEKPYARAAVGLDRNGQTLWLVVIDGKQPRYSEGMTLAEVAAILQELGAETALNLDGGGSTTLVTTANGLPQILNAPIHTKWPMRERPVATQLGFYANSVTAE
ncbi:phosphodiester glycosidase family protein [Sphaerothrix gracilis]|uniref:phosphodiester glycosidase family protein n=1 Tax=Sphaerothrix gracilis TaxID=3151835 RepID=UPI0031FC1190